MVYRQFGIFYGQTTGDEGEGRTIGLYSSWVCLIEDLCPLHKASSRVFVVRRSFVLQGEIACVQECVRRNGRKKEHSFGLRASRTEVYVVKIVIKMSDSEDEKPTMIKSVVSGEDGIERSGSIKRRKPGMKGLAMQMKKLKAFSNVATEAAKVNSKISFFAIYLGERSELQAL